MANCFYCGLENDDGHPTCGRPDCDTKVHGHGADGKRTYNYCPTHREGGAA